MLIEFLLFTISTRKRMSVIVRTPEGKIKLYCKGAVSSKVYCHCIYALEFSFS